MATMLDEVKDFLAGAGLGLAYGTNLFTGRMPQTPDGCVALLEDPGAQPDYRLGAAVEAENPRLRVRVRDADYDAGRTLAESVYKKLAAVVNQSLGAAGTTTYFAITPLSQPYEAERDQEGDRVIFQFACMVSKAVS